MIGGASLRFIFEDPAYETVVRRALRHLPPMSGAPSISGKRTVFRDRHGEVACRRRFRGAPHGLRTAAWRVPAVFVHELFHFVWLRKGNAARRSYEDVVRAECCGLSRRARLVRRMAQAGAQAARHGYPQPPVARVLLRSFSAIPRLGSTPNRAAPGVHSGGAAPQTPPGLVRQDGGERRVVRYNRSRKRSCVSTALPAASHSGHLGLLLGACSTPSGSISRSRQPDKDRKSAPGLHAQGRRRQARAPLDSAAKW